MRLKPNEVAILLSIGHSCFGESASIWLFGSRTDDNKRGGDIDLYIETDQKGGLVASKLKMLGALEDYFGEQKIDLLIRSRRRPLNAMHEIAKSSGIQL